MATTNTIGEAHAREAEAFERLTVALLATPDADALTKATEVRCTLRERAMLAVAHRMLHADEDDPEAGRAVEDWLAGSPLVDGFTSMTKRERRIYNYTDGTVEAFM